MKLIRKNILLINDGNSDKGFLINVPIGIDIHNDEQKPRYIVEENTKEYVLIKDKDKSDVDYTQKIRLYKSGYAKDFTYNKEKLTISLIYNNFDYLNAIKLIKDYHYMPYIPNGLFITLKKNQTILGVIVLAKLTHTLAPVGRQIYFSGESIKEKELKIELKEFSNKCVSWISRIIIADLSQEAPQESQSKGFGEAFLNQLPDFLFNIYPNNKLEFIEVLTSIDENKVAKKVEPETLTTDKFKSFQYEKDFFCKAGYTNVTLPDKKVLGRRKDKQENESNWIKVKKFYYMKEINEQNRLFIPLTKEAYQWFETGNKQWEIRKFNVGQYNSKNLIVGRKVELRLGYRPGNSIWGIIKEVRSFDNAESLVSEIDFKYLIPSANNPNEAIQRIIDYISPESKIIAIKIQRDE